MTKPLDVFILVKKILRHPPYPQVNQFGGRVLSWKEAKSYNELMNRVVVGF